MRSAQAKVEMWTYGHLLESITPDLLAADPWGTFGVLEGLLDHALTLGRDSPPFDGSAVWYRDLAEDIHDPPFSVEEVLTRYLRDAALKLASLSGADLSEVVRRLDAGRWAIFKRLALHVLRTHADTDPEILRTHLLRRSGLSGTTLWPEYGALLRDRFAELPPGAQRTILAWILEGPEPDKVEKWDRGGYDKNLLANEWKLRRLTLVSPHLTGEARAAYDTLVESLGAIDDPEHHIGQVQTWVGPTSPKRAGDLRGMSVPAVVDFLQEWEPPRGWAVDTPEGLARELASDVATRPSEYAAAAEKFRTLEPTYVRGLFQGLREAFKETTLDIDWESVLSLAAWVLEQPGELPEQSEDDDRDPGWAWTRKAIAALLSTAMSTKSMKIELRSQVWPIIDALSQDPNPTPEYEARYGAENMDPPTLAINTVRGEAFHAIVRYALWIHQAGEVIEGDGFERMPEVQDRLERALITQEEPSAAIRSVFGQFFPWLVLLDDSWAASNARPIFEEAPDGGGLGRVAWETYLLFCAPYNSVLPILRWRYGEAVKELDASRASIDPRDADVQLGEHLIIYYVRKLVTLDEVTDYFRRASPPVAAAAVGFVGRWLMNRNDWQPEGLEMIVGLWERLVDREIFQLPNEAFPEFGWWVASRVLDPAWALAQAEAAVALGDALDGGHFLAEAVEQMASTHPHDAVSTLRAVLLHDKTEWNLISWREPGMRILRRALREGSSETKRAAEESASLFVARGFVEFQRVDDDSSQPESSP